jgi:hypothetical protein
VNPRKHGPLLTVACAALLALPNGGLAAEGKADFTRDIEPIFSESCYSCHGEKKQESGLRMDSRAALLHGGDNGPSLVPGDSKNSILIQVVAGTHPDIMTMPKKKDRLTAEQIDRLRAWIDQGAAMPEADTAAAQPKQPAKPHWAFIAPTEAPLPKVKSSRRVINPIDRFVFAGLEAKGLSPSPEAEKTTLIRRLSLDLTGLPPTVEEVDAFLADRSRKAYDKLVDRLLASPHYGEKWGRWWLDAARYADSNGFEKDRTRTIWPYRDWVINALNADMPFNQFTIEQLAGDILAAPNGPAASVVDQSLDRTKRDLRIATGFLRNSMMNMEGGVEPEKFRVESLIDRVDAVGRTWLGLTVACAQCHNHKYDPISQKEYYQFYAFLNQDDEPRIEVPTAVEAARRAEVLGKVRDLEDRLLADADIAGSFKEWLATAAQPQGDWQPLDAKEWHSTPMKFEKQEDLSMLAGGDVHNTGVLRVWVDVPHTNITGFRLEALNHPNLPGNGPGIMGDGDFMVNEFTVDATPLDEIKPVVPGVTNTPATTNRIVFRRAIADWEAPKLPASRMIDGTVTNDGWASATSVGRRNEERRAVFEAEKPFGFPGGTRLLVTVSCNPPGGLDVTGGKVSNYLIGHLRLSLTTEAGPLKVDPLSERQRRSLSGDAPLTRPSATLSPSDGERAGVRGLPSGSGPSSAGKPSFQPDPKSGEPHQAKGALEARPASSDIHRELFREFLFKEPSLATRAAEWETLWNDWPKVETTTLALVSRATPRKTHVFRRGDWQRLDDEVEPGTPAVLPAFDERLPRNRLGLAKWIVDERNPLTARVIVNRVWQQYFGEGLVTTPEDFGVRSEKPPYPELLDWLAVEFMHRGWSLKELHRLIATSATYRQSSRVTPELLEQDPYNRLLTRGPRIRVDAEAIQDIALSVSGLLSPKVGGPSVFPPLPDGVMSLSYGPIPWNISEGDDRYRRAMYTFWKRSVPYPAMVLFDAPTAEQSCVRRVRSNTPLQALVTLNEPTFIQASRWLAYRVLQETDAATDDARLILAFRTCTARKPDATELKSLRDLLGDLRKEFAATPGDAARVAFNDPKSPVSLPGNASMTDLAAWSALSRTLLNLDETITKE